MTVLQFVSTASSLIFLGVLFTYGYACYKERKAARRLKDIKSSNHWLHH